jgi:hypothetical protein
MKDWPRLSVAAIKNIESEEETARRDLADSVRPYTPANPTFRRDHASLLASGLRVIDYICAYAESLIDSSALGVPIL